MPGLVAVRPRCAATPHAPSWCLVTGNQSGLLGLLLIVGLFVAYGVQRRRQRQERLPRRAEPSPNPEPAADAPASPRVDDPPARSADLGCLPIVPSVLLLLVVTHRGDFWGTLWQVVFFSLVAVAAWSALSPSEFARASRGDPEMTRRDHILTMGVGFVVLPLLGWVVAVPLRWDPGFLIPALPWAVLLAYGYIAAAFPRPKG